MSLERSVTALNPAREPSSSIGATNSRYPNLENHRADTKLMVSKFLFLLAHFKILANFSPSLVLLIFANYVRL